MLRRHAVINDKIETDLSQRETKFFRRAVDRARGARQVGAQIDDWNDLCVAHSTLLLPAGPTVCLTRSVEETRRPEIGELSPLLSTDDLVGHRSAQEWRHRHAAMSDG